MASVSGSSSFDSAASASSFERDPTQFCASSSCLGLPWHEWLENQTTNCQQQLSTNCEQLELFDDLQKYAFEAEEFTNFDDPSLPACNAQQLPQPQPQPQSELQQLAKPQKSRFGTPKTEGEILLARRESVPKRTRQDTAYCIRLWNEWSKYRCETSEVHIPLLMEMDAYSLQYWMTRFILEVRKQNGDEYPPNTLHHLVCGIMRFLRQNGKPQLDFFKDDTFADFRSSLDGEMKRLQSKGVGSRSRQAEPLTVDEEETLWRRKILGDHNPQSLLYTVFFMIGFYFALRSGDEHRQALSDPSGRETRRKAVFAVHRGHI